MKKIIFYTTVVNCICGSVYAESIKINPKTITQSDTDIEVGDSEAHRIQKQNENLYFFVGGNLKMVLPLYTYDFDLYIDNNPVAWGFGLETGIKFRKDKYIYHPGIRFMYEKFYNSGTLEYTVYNPYYNTYTIDLDITHNVYGGVFDNYFRIAHNQPSIFGGYNVNDFFILGIGYGKINTKYEVSNYNYAYEDKGNTWILDLGYLSQFDNGLGITFDTKYYFPDNETVDAIFTFDLGLRYSF